MNAKAISIIVISFLLVCVCGSAYSAEGEVVLEVYLPREVTIENDSPKLGQIGIVRGAEAVVAKASEIALGRISVSGQELVVDRSVVLSRLASNGIFASMVRVTGAAKTIVRRRERVIKGSDFVELAGSYLEKHLPDSSICQWKPIRMPKDLVIPGTSDDLQLSAQISKANARGLARVEVFVLCGGKGIQSREVIFRLKYNCRKVTAAIDIAKGEVISGENIKIEKAISNYPEPTNWTLPYGLVAKRRIPAGREISSNMVGPVRAAVLVKRNQNVIIKIDRLGLFITAMGKSTQEGRVGEYVRVRNLDSGRMVMAKVNEDGTVEPVF